MPRRARALVERITTKLGALLDKDKSQADNSTQSNGKTPQLGDSHTAKSGQHNGAAAASGTARQSKHGLLSSEKNHPQNDQSRNHAAPAKINRVPVGRPNGSISKTTTREDHQFEKLPDIDTGDTFGIAQSTYHQSTNGTATNGGERQFARKSDTNRGSSFGLDRDTSHLPTGHGGNQFENLPGIDLNDTVDTDYDINHAPAVTHETVIPHVHEIVEEQITRDIHTHEHRHYIQPIYELEVLPARHFLEDSEGDLVEVSEADLPDCTGPNQRWQIAEREPLDGTWRQFDVIAKQMDQGKKIEEGKNLLIGKRSVNGNGHAEENRLIGH